MTYALYDLANDIGETANVFFDHPDVVARLTKKISSDISRKAREKIGLTINNKRLNNKNNRNHETD